MQNFYNFILIAINILLYSFAFLWHFQKTRRIDIGFFALFLCMVISILGGISFFFSKGQYIPYLQNLSAIPFFYLFASVMCSLTPLLSYNPTNIQLRSQNKVSIQAICVLCGVLVIIQTPEIIPKVFFVIQKLFLSKNGSIELYEATKLNAIKQGYGISNVWSILSNALTDICIFLLVYHLLAEKIEKARIVPFALLIVFIIIRRLFSGERSGVATIFISFICAILLFKDYIPKSRIRKIKKIVAILSICLCIPLLAITIGRFNNAKSTQGSVSSVLWYLGQPMIFFNNYGLDAGGTRHGDRTILLFKKALGIEVPHNYVERRNKYQHLKADDYIFTTYIGDLTIDFGPITAFFIVVIFSILFTSLTRPRNGTIQFCQLLLLFCCANICCQGIISLFTYSDIGGNIRLITYFLFYFYFKYNNRKKDYEEGNSSSAISSAIPSNSRE